MINLLGAEGSPDISSIILMVVLVVLLVAYVIFGMRSRKKNQEKAMKMLNELKAGDKVVTNAGIYGEVVSMKETNMGKVVTIKTGDDESKKTSFITVNASVILGIDEKQDLILDKDGNVIDENSDKEALKKEVLKEASKKEENKTKKETTIVESASNDSNNSEINAEDNEIINKIKKKSTKK